MKKALAHSSTQTSKNIVHLHSIFISTFAILFFGTPHNGASKSNWLVPLRGRDTPAHIYQNEILSVVKKDSESLQMITAEFSPLMKQFHIFFFWEEVPTDLGNRTVFVVEESSAAPLMYNTERSGIPANHEGMVRFPSSSCSSYRTVIEALKRYCREAPKVVAGRWRQTNDLLARTRSHEASELVGTGFDVHNGNEPFYYQPKVYEKSRNKHFYPPQPVSSIFTGREDISAVVESSLLLKMILAHLVSSEGSSFTVLVDQGRHSSAANLPRITVISNRILRPRIFDHFLIACDVGFGQYSLSTQPL